MSDLTTQIENVVEASPDELEDELPDLLDAIEGQTTDVVSDDPEAFAELVANLEETDIAGFVEDNPDTADQFQELLWSGMEVLAARSESTQGQMNMDITVNFEADDCPMTGYMEIDSGEKTLTGGAGHLDDPILEITGPADTLVGLMTGSVDPVQGFMSQQYNLDGPVDKGTQLAPVMDSLSDDIPA
jgi:putative sterol carrier protein